MTDSKIEGKSGDFFAVDRRAWLAVCEHGINAATAYLVMARGTGPDQRTTSWSVNAVENYTGISRPRAQTAIGMLAKAGLVRITRTGTRPRYYLTPAHEVRRPEDPSPPLDRQIQVRGQPEAAAEPDWIWLPNILVDGAGDNFAAPVELVRQTQSIAAMRLFIDLYHAHRLAADGGIHWRTIRQKTRRYTAGRRGSFTVYGFVEADVEALPKAFGEPHTFGDTEKLNETVFWDAWSLLHRLGLLEFVNHVVEADTDEAEVIHPYAVGSGNGEREERLLAKAAHRAGELMLTEAQRKRARIKGGHLVPVRQHRTEVQMVGIARLRYRPRTSATALWMSRMAQWRELAAYFEELAGEISSLNTDLQRQGLQYQRISR